MTTRNVAHRKGESMSPEEAELMRRLQEEKERAEKAEAELAEQERQADWFRSETNRLTSELAEAGEIIGGLEGLWGKLDKEIKRKDEELEWYGDKARDMQSIKSAVYTDELKALREDGGKRARDAGAGGQGEEESGCVSCAQLIKGEKAADREIDRLRACMKRAGLECFMKNGTPEEVADHMHKVAKSWIEHVQETHAEMCGCGDPMAEKDQTAWLCNRCGTVRLIERDTET